MAETTESKKRTRSKSAKSVKIETGTVEELGGFAPEELARLVQAREKVASGTYTDITPEHRKLLFVQWLIEHERLKS